MLVFLRVSCTHTSTPCHVGWSVVIAVTSPSPTELILSMRCVSVAEENNSLGFPGCYFLRQHVYRQCACIWTLEDKLPLVLPPFGVVWMRHHLGSLNDGSWVDFIHLQSPASGFEGRDPVQLVLIAIFQFCMISQFDILIQNPS